MALYAMGGLAPTIGALAAVLATRRQSPFCEFRSRLFRWRVGALWYAVAIGIPLTAALIAAGAARLLSAAGGPLFLRPWYAFFPLLVFMIAGGGLEELGWRGVAQPELERHLGRELAAVIVGIAWSAWHLPLFFLPGTTQYRTSFLPFSVQVLGAAMILAWLCGHTRSILLCILFHAALNASWLMLLIGAPGGAIRSNYGAPICLLTGSMLLMEERIRSRKGPVV
jgi:uncharacterized protein